MHQISASVPYALVMAMASSGDAVLYVVIFRRVSVSKMSTGLLDASFDWSCCRGLVVAAHVQLSLLAPVDRFGRAAGSWDPAILDVALDTNECSAEPTRFDL